MQPSLLDIGKVPGVKLPGGGVFTNYQNSSGEIIPVYLDSNGNQDRKIGEMLQAIWIQSQLGVEAQYKQQMNSLFNRVTELENENEFLRDQNNHLVKTLIEGKSAQSEFNSVNSNPIYILQRK